MIREHTISIYSLLKLVVLILWPRIWFDLKSVSCTLEKNIYSAISGLAIWVSFHGLFLHLLLLDFNASTVILMLYWAFPVGWLSSKRIPLQCRRCLRQGFYPWIKKSPCRRAWQSTPGFLPPESHGQMRLAGYSPWGHKE